ncbi:MAG TPA: glycosyltransferase family 4 protein [Panacibacter sp.]|nr:glycosyltransferase family 4 protein [Panacibacter sp.]HNP46563.1 glycosyltransferase family 4 protein [Panacibacter sp.]
MISGKTIFIAHNWSDVSVSYQSKWLATELSKDNTVIFFNAKKSGSAEMTINDRLLVVEWPGKRPNGIKDLLFAIRLFRRYQPQLVISNFAANDIMLFVASFFAVSQRVCYYHTMVQQYIEDVGRLDLAQRINIWRKGFAFRRATHVLAVSSAAKADITRYYKVNPEKCFVFPNALPDTDTRHCGGNHSIGFLGRLQRSKGADILLHAFKLLLTDIPGLRLLIAGSGEESASLQELSHSLGIQDKVVFNGSISYTAIHRFIASLDVLAVPSRIDNLPTVILEAFSVGTPVIASNAGGIPDMIGHAVNGLLFESGNAEDLAANMLLLFNNETLRAKLSENARSTFEKRYSLRHYRERFEAVVEQPAAVGD